MARDLDRAFYIKQLFEKQLDKTSPKKNYEERLKEAAERLDALIGPEWRVEVKIPGIEIMDIPETCGPSPAVSMEMAVQGFYDRVDAIRDKEGLGVKPIEVPQDEEELAKRKQTSSKKTLKQIVSKFFER